MRIALALVLVLVTGCTTVDSLKPGVARNVRESGFMKTTEGLSMTIPNRSYDEVWAAADKAMTTAGTVSAGLYSGRLRIVDRDKARGVIRSEEENSFGATRAFVGIFITPPTAGAASYVVEVSKILRARTEVIQGRNWEVDLLRAIQADVGGA